MRACKLAGSASLLVIAAAGCPADGPTPLVRVPVGPAGGTVATSGIALGFPPGALSITEEISVYREDITPAGLDDLLSPVYRFEPSGLVLEQPALVNIVVPEGAVGRVYWSRLGDDTVLEPVGFASGGRGRAWIDHFSVATVDGSACQANVTWACECVPDPLDPALRQGTAPTDPLCIGSRFPSLPGTCVPGRDWTTTYPRGTEVPADASCFGWRRRQVCACLRPGSAYRPASADPNMCNGTWFLTGTDSRNPDSWTCGGDFAHFGWPGGDCNGTYLARDSANNLYSSMIMGRLDTCREPTLAAHESATSEGLNGWMRNCEEQVPETARPEDGIPPTQPSPDTERPPTGEPPPASEPPPADAPVPVESTFDEDSESVDCPPTQRSPEPQPPPAEPPPTPSEPPPAPPPDPPPAE